MNIPDGSVPPNRIQTSTQATIYDDKDIEEIRISIIWKPGRTSKDASPFVMERVLLKYLADHFPVWAEYWMKPGSTLG